ncbi:MAG: glycogen/starch synthase [Clostridiales bacterium]|nr:glycogen/starch synthase [Clostridiales bacterium]
MPGTNTVSKKKRASTAVKKASAAPKAAVQAEQVSTEKKKKLLFVGAEVMPFAATGGLGDVLGSLPEALAAFDPSLDVRVVMPLYSAVGEKYRAQMKTEAVFTVALAWRRQYCGVLSLEKNGVKYYFIDNEYYFKRDGLYGQYDDGERYAFFCTAVMDMMPVLGYFPDILHAHDWQAALTVIYLHQKYRRDERWSRMRSVFTIHNIEYQGKYDFFILGDVFGLSEFDRSVVECDGVINLMKGAIECADRVSTVSPRYASEILSPEYAHGLDGVLRRNAGKLRGILNGIDYSYYDPKADPVLAENYGAEDIGGKYACRSSLRRDLSLPDDADRPLIAVISRLASHKGVDLVREALRGILRSTGAQFVVLGKGEAEYEEFFRSIEAEFPNRARALITYDRELSRRIYAAADIFLMPSKSEPCGLAQMIASRYGAIPVVRETGGLYDSIHGYWEDENGVLHGNGFTFAGYTAGELYERTCAAVSLWHDEPKRKKFIKMIMSADFSWRASAAEYAAMYRSVEC